MFTKSGIMVGLGEERNEVLQLMDDCESADVDFLTIGQYLQPTAKHHPIARFVTPDEFESLHDHRPRQGLPDGGVLPADALLASCRRGFRPAQGGAGGEWASDPCRSFATHHEVPHSTDEMFDLVADVEAYPQFVPHVHGNGGEIPRRGGGQGNRRRAA